MKKSNSVSLLVLILFLSLSSAMYAPQAKAEDEGFTDNQGSFGLMTGIAVPSLTGLTSRFVWGLDFVYKMDYDWGLGGYYSTSSKK